MKKLISILILTLVLIQSAITCYAANAVPQEVVSACDSVVRIYADYGEEYATGTGFVISNDNNETLIVTNHHVAVSDNPVGLLVLLNTNTDIQATVVASDESKDLAVIKVAFPLGITPITFAENNAEKGDAVYTIGYPSAADVLSNEMAITNDDSTITDGIISAVRTAKITENGTDTEILQITAAINAGNSGGPLVNEKGEVVGICTYGITDSQGIFGAISVLEIKAFLDANGITYQLTKQEEAKTPIWIYFAIGAGIVLFIVLMVVLISTKKKKTEDTDTWTTEGGYSAYTAEYEKEKAKRKPINKKLLIGIGVALLLIGIIGGYVYSYNKAVEYAKAGDSEKARKYIVIEQITNLHDPNLIPYLEALDVLATGDLDAADAVFASMSGYLNADAERAMIAQRKEQEKADKYEQAMNLYNGHDYDGAYQIFVDLGDYKDSAEKTAEIKGYEDKYNQAVVQEENGDYLSAKATFGELGQISYRDSGEKSYECYGKYLLDQVEKGELENALRLADSFAKETAEGEAVREEILSIAYEKGVSAYHNKDKVTAKKYMYAVDDYGGYNSSDDYMDLIKYSDELSGEYEQFLDNHIILTEKYFNEAINRLKQLGDLEDAKLLLSKMEAWHARYEREKEAYSNKTVKMSELNKSREKQEAQNTTESSNTMSYAQIMNANFIGTWVSVVTEDWYSQKTIRITETGAFVTEHYVSRLFNSRTDLDDAGPYTWWLEDRTSQGHCPALHIDGYLKIYVSGIDDEKFWSDSQGLTFYRQ